MAALGLESLETELSLMNRRIKYQHQAGELRRRGPQPHMGRQGHYGMTVAYSSGAAARPHARHVVMYPEHARWY